MYFQAFRAKSDAGSVRYATLSPESNDAQDESIDARQYELHEPNAFATGIYVPKSL